MNQSSIFLIGKKNNNYEFNQFPDNLYVDTCFWNEVYGKGNNTYRSECSEFLEDCASNGTKLLTSGIVETELKHVIKNSMVADSIKPLHISLSNRKFQYPNGSVNYKKVYSEILKKDPEFALKIDDEIKTVLSQIKKVSIFLNFDNNQEFGQEVDKVLRNTDYIMGSYDAEHVVISHMWSTNSIATIDGDYWTLDNTNIFTPPKSEYKNIRLPRANVFLPYDKDKY